MQTQPDEPALTVDNVADDEGNHERQADGTANIVPRVVYAVDFIRAKVGQRFSIPFWWAGIKHQGHGQLWEEKFKMRLAEKRAS